MQSDDKSFRGDSPANEEARDSDERSTQVPLKRETLFVAADRQRTALIAALCSFLGVGTGFALSQMASANNNHCHQQASYEVLEIPQPIVETSRIQEMAWLGVVTTGSAQHRGALVVEVFDNSPAERAGLVAGDLIVDLGGVSILNSGSLVRQVRKHQIGTEMRLVRLSPDGERIESQVTLGGIDPDDLRDEASRRRLRHWR